MKKEISLGTRGVIAVFAVIFILGFILGGLLLC